MATLLISGVNQCPQSFSHSASLSTSSLHLSQTLSHVSPICPSVRDGGRLSTNISSYSRPRLSRYVNPSRSFLPTQFFISSRAYLENVLRFVIKYDASRVS